MKRPAVKRPSNGVFKRLVHYTLYLYLSLSVSMDWQAFWLTIRLATVVTAILLAFGLPLAYWIAFSRWRWKFLVEAAVGRPIVLPPTVLRVYVLISLWQRSPLARLCPSITANTLPLLFTPSVS